VNKTLLITRGAPGAGKTTFLKKLGLYSFVVSSDQIRCEIGGIKILPNGAQQRGIVDESKVWSRVEEEIITRMHNDNTVIIDATFQKKLDFKMPLRTAKLYQYEVKVIDFTMISEKKAISQNANRQGWQLVPPKVISEAYKNYRKEKLDHKIKNIPYFIFEDTALCKHLQKEAFLKR